MIGVIDTGGGERGIYGAGVLDYCMRNGIRFDYCAGVSAGSANVVSYMAGQRGRNLRFYVDYNCRPQAMGLHQLVYHRNYINLDYIYGTVSVRGGEDPLDYPALKQSGKILRVVATDAQTAEAVYFSQKDMEQDQYDIMKCSSCVPGVNKPYPFRGREYFDGGVSDPIPIQKALADGCDKVVVILTKPAEPIRTGKADQIAADKLRDRYPLVSRKILERSALYNQELELCRRLQEEGKVLIIAPDSIGTLKTLTRDKEQLKHLYHKGEDDATALIGFLGIKIDAAAAATAENMLSYPC